MDTNQSVHLPGFSAEKIAEIRKALTCPKGTLLLKFSDPTFIQTCYSYKARPLIFIEVPAGVYGFRLEKYQDNLKFYHSSPGQGTRIASIDMRHVEQWNEMAVGLTWSDKEITLIIGNPNDASTFISEVGAVSTGKKLMVTSEGEIIEVGDAGIEVSTVSIWRQGNKVLATTAIDNWNFIIRAADLMSKLLDLEQLDIIQKTVIANQIISMLVTGFETYCQKRFVEIVQEGRTSNYVKLLEKFTTTEERNTGIADKIHQEATQSGISSTEVLVRGKRIDFQNWDRCKMAYAAAYGIRFSELGQPNTVIERIQRVIKYRHRIIHVSPLEEMLNAPQVPPEQPEFGVNIAKDTISLIDVFIQALHKKTLGVPAL